MDETTTGDISGEAAALQARLFESLVPSLELLTVEVGVRGGLYSALHATPDVTAQEFARVAGVAPRYSREWLEQQATAGIIEVAHAGDGDDTRRYRLPPGHAEALLDPDSPYAIAGASTFLMGIARALDELVDDLASGAGVPYSSYGREARHAIAGLNRPGFIHLIAEWAANLPEVAERLADGGTILDAGCGTGWSAIALARAFPRAEIVGIDLDAASIEEATANAAEAGVSDRVRFALADAGDSESVRDLVGGEVVLVTVFEALHDMLEPARVLSSLGSLLEPDGAILVGDEKVADDFTPDGDFLERINYAFSILHCLPSTMAEGSGEANGTVLRAPTVSRWAREAGLGEVRVLSIEHDLWRFYRIDKS
jgi:SAM-dependent methyltransferase